MNGKAAKITAKVTIELDEKWAANHPVNEMVDFLKTFIDTRLGFRGIVKKVKITERG